jgi:hypothetical protein
MRIFRIGLDFGIIAAKEVEGKMNDKKIVLVVGIGTSPAVMTETVWALAHQIEAGGIYAVR